MTLAKKSSMMNDGIVHTLEWHVESYTVGKDKRVLQNIAGKTETGELTAIMGPSGAGKTTLLECISLRNRGFEGAIHFDGKAVSGDYFTTSALVHQKELLFGFMTTHEYLLFHGIARMSQLHNQEFIYQRVNEVLEEVNLEKCRDTIIGGTDPVFMAKGLSGGERKRLAIAAELIMAPRIIFLDEPSSGLDSVMAESIFDTMHALSQRGRIVMASVHSPSSDVCHLFSHVLLLTCHGQIAYHGQTNKAIDYFARLGYLCPDHYNPADFFLKTVAINTYNGNQKKAGAQSKEDQELRIENLQIAYLRSNLSIKEPLPVDQVHKEYQAVRGRQVGYWTLFKLNLWRNVIKQRRDKLSLILWAAVSGSIGLIYGLLFWQQGSTSWRNLMGGVFSVLMSGFFMSSLAVILQFPMDFAIVVREYFSAANAVGPYLSAKFVTEAATCYGPFLLGTLAYWMIGLEPTFKAYILYIAVFISFSWACLSLGLLISSFHPNPRIGMVILPLFFSPMILFSGVLCKSSDVPQYLRWLQYVSLPYYTFSAIMKEQSHILGPQFASFLEQFVEVNNLTMGQNIGVLWAFNIYYQLNTYFILSARIKKAGGA